jgi:hypothetical protein
MAYIFIKDENKFNNIHIYIYRNEGVHIMTNGGVHIMTNEGVHIMTNGGATFDYHWNSM